MSDIGAGQSDAMGNAFGDGNEPPGGVGRLQRVPQREVWPHEAADFTTWLRRTLMF